MSLASKHSSQPLITSVFLDSRSSHVALVQALLELSQCPAIYRGEIHGATTAITYAVVKNLGVSRCQVWLFTDDKHIRFKAIAHYGTISADEPSQPIQVTDHPDYFHNLFQRSWLVVDTNSVITHTPNGNIASDFPETSQQNNDWQKIFPPYLLSQQQTTTAFIEVPIWHQDNIVGILCCDQQETPRVWQAAEKSFMVTATNLIALAISHNSNQKQTQTCLRQKRQLKQIEIERQQADQAWQESQRFIQGILDASTNILYVNDFASGTNHYVNGYMQKILGYSPEEIQRLGAQFLEKIAHTDDINTIHQARRKLARSSSGDIVENEYRLQHKQGSWHWMLCRETIFQWNSDGTPLQLFGTATDITVHKEKAEALQQKNQELTALARIDALTQVANRRAFDEFLDHAWAALNQTPLTRMALT